MRTSAVKSVNRRQSNRQDCWQEVQHLDQGITAGWSQSQVRELQQRKRWTKMQENFSAGQMVLFHDDNLPLAKWKLGRVAQVNVGKDDVIRSAYMDTATGQYERPVVKLTVLSSVTSE